MRTGSSYLSQSELPLTFGLGTAAKADEVTIVWPSGKRDVLGALDAGQEYTVTEGKGVTGKRASATMTAGTVHEALDAAGAGRSRPALRRLRAGCTVGFGVGMRPRPGRRRRTGICCRGRRRTRRRSPTATGAQPLGLDSGRDGVIYVPPGLTGPAPLFVLLHGATGSAAGITRRTDAFALADELKMVILAPDSRERTWDAIRGQFGPDVAFLDKALAKVFEMVPIDRKRVAIGGFSDGASYAISLGLQNGDLFTHVAAFSPGFFVGNQRRGRPHLLRLARQARRDPAVRQRPAAASCPSWRQPLQRPLQGIRRPAYGAGADRARSLRMDGREERALSAAGAERASRDCPSSSRPSGSRSTAPPSP